MSSGRRIQRRERMKKHILCTLLAVLVPGVAVFAGTSATENETISAVVANNKEVSAAQKRYLSAGAEALSSWGLKNPVLEAEFMDMDSSGFAPASAGSKSIAVSQEIPFPAKIPFMAGAAYERANAERYRYELARRQAGLKAYKAYASFYRITKEIEIIKEAAAAFRQVSQIASAEYGRAKGAYGESAVADLEYALLHNRLIFLEAEAGVAASLINTLSDGVLRFTTETKPAPPSMAELPGTAEQLIEAAVENSPEVMIMEAEARMAENERNGEFLNFFPDLSIKLKKQTEPASANYAFMIEAEIPLWFFANNIPAAVKAGNDYEARKAAYEEGKNRAAYEAKHNYEAARRYERAIKLYSEILIPRAEAIFKSAVTDYRSGNGGFMGVIDSQKKLLEMKADYLMFVEKYVTYYNDLMACCAVSFLRNGEIYETRLKPERAGE